MQILNDDFVWPSDADRAENLALDRVCAELEDLVDRLEAADTASNDASVPALERLDFALSFALCHFDLVGTRCDVKKARALLPLVRTELEAAADVAADRQAVLDLAAQALGVDGEPHQGRDQRILEAIDALAAHWGRAVAFIDSPYGFHADQDERWRRIRDDAPATSLSHLKAQWQAEALASLRADWQAKGVLNPQESLMLMNREQELRRQAERGE